jgi:opacity protein-like surface antigen
MERPSRYTLAFAVALVLGASTSAAAQHSGDGYLFHQPDATFTIRGGYALANAGSDLFAFTTEQLTLNKRDFSGFTFGGDVAMRIASRLDLTLDGGYSRSKKGSEFRHFIDNKNLPIQQTTLFERVPLTANLKYFLTSPGRSIGSLAWIPAKFAPYVGVGGGAMWYRFRQEGDFVDFKTSNVFPSSFDSNDWTVVGQGMVGADYSISPSMAINADARYLWAKANVGRDFGGFNRIDLSGVSATVGLSFRL